MAEEIKQNNVLKEAVLEMAKVGAYLGKKKSKSHPKMKPYVLTARNDTLMINLEKTYKSLINALDFLREIKKKGGVVLFVGTKVAAKKLVKEAALKINMPYVWQRWLGGTLTNFEIIQKRLNYFDDLEKKSKAGELEKYTKWEQLQFEEELKKLEEKFGGLKNIKKLPDALFIIDSKEEETALREAKRMKIPVVALINTDTDPTLIDWPIPINNNAGSAINYVLEKVKEIWG
ncbi:MAG: 30S ribosomal protein S2 [Parcubacteria group bacterium]|nr:30S ribosomal protein S2 [Parcubacteria group bacterium]